MCPTILLPTVCSPSMQGCLGSLPPSSCPLNPTTATYVNPDQPPSASCSSPGAKYAWSADCAKQLAVNGTCAGSAFCGLGGETVAATAECTAAGWNVTDDGCYPAGCSKMPGGPSYDPTFFADCPLPGHINQVRGLAESTVVCNRRESCTSGMLLPRCILCSPRPLSCVCTNTCRFYNRTPCSAPRCLLLSRPTVHLSGTCSVGVHPNLQVRQCLERHCNGSLQGHVF